jgi:RNA 3'-terminal phosphate cyclase
MALSQEKSTFMVRTISEHIETNIWLMEKILNAKFKIQKVNNLFKIEKNS